MKNTSKYMVLYAIAVLIGTASSALAASGGKAEGSGVLIVLFLAFGALIIVFQLIPGVILFVSMVKGLFGKEKKAVVVEKNSGEH
jgi:hypothetical protein